MQFTLQRLVKEIQGIDGGLWSMYLKENYGDAAVVLRRNPDIYESSVLADFVLRKDVLSHKSIKVL
jgi:hypothetical protein